MRLLLLYRPNGDELSVGFSPDDTLSTAYLTIKDEQWDVSSFLPGLKISNLEYYKDLLGFTGVDTRVDDAQHYLEDRGLSCDKILSVDSKEISMYIIQGSDRSIPCPIVVAIGRFSLKPFGVLSIKLDSISILTSL